MHEISESSSQLSTATLALTNRRRTMNDRTSKTLIIALIAAMYLACGSSEPETPPQPEEITLSSQLIGVWQADMQATLDHSELEGEDLARARRFAAVIEMQIEFQADGTAVSRANVVDENAEVHSSWEATQVSATVLRVQRTSEDLEDEEFVVLFESDNRMTMTNQATGEEVVFVRQSTDS